LFSARLVRLTTSLRKLGQSIAIVLCAGSTLLSAGADSAPCQKSASFNLQEFASFSYWSIKPWFLTEGKLVASLIKPYTWGNPTPLPTKRTSSSFLASLRGHQASFLAPLPGRRRISARGVPHAQSLYFVLVFLLLYRTLFAFIIKNTQKN
jgi:hypothetical protein